MKAWQNIHGYQGGSKFSTWLYSIAYRTAISKLRGRRASTTHLDELPEMSAVAERSAQTTTDDRSAALELALAALPTEDAAVVSLFYLQEQNIEEIVTATGLSASNVKVKLHRSRKKMFDTLQRHLKHELWTLQQN